MKPKVAILGANGFVGFRAFEIWTQSTAYSPRAVVRRPASLARISRFDGDWKLADATDEEGLAQAFKDCDFVINCVVGNEQVIEKTATSVLRACDVAAVKRLVFLSSASVHGQNPASGTNEESPLDDKQLYWYNNAKIKAERALLSAAKDAKTECVILRPGIVWGPRSSWIGGFCEDLLNGTPVWLENGEGICNSIFVDNLIHAMEQAMTQPSAEVNGEVFLLNDPEETRWKDLYYPVMEWFGQPHTSIINGIAQELVPKTLADTLLSLKSTSAVQTLLGVIPAKCKETAKAAIKAWSAPPKENAFALPKTSTSKPTLSAEMTQLYRCRYRLPYSKAAAHLKYEPPVTRSEALKITREWLVNAGYPISVEPQPS